MSPIAPFTSPTPDYKTVAAMPGGQEFGQTGRDGPDGVENNAQSQVGGSVDGLGETEAQIAQRRNLDLSSQ
jgi:hypothetical protein